MIITLSALYGLSLALSISGAEICGGIFILRALCLWWVKRAIPQFLFSALPLSLILYVCWSLTSTLIGRSASFADGISEHSAILIFFLFAYGIEPKSIKKIIYWYCVGSAVVAVWGIAQMAVDHKFFFIVRHASNRAVGSRSHPLTFAESFIPALFIFSTLVSYKLFSGRFQIGKAWREILGLLLIEIAIVLSYSRAVWLAITAGFLILCSRMSRRQALVAILLFFLPMTIFFFNSSNLRKRLVSIFPSHVKKESSTAAETKVSSISVPNVTQSPAIALEVEDEATSIRFHLWKQALQAIAHHPVLGVGIDGARLVTVTRKNGQERIWSDSHNIFLQAALESGLIGLGLFIWVLVIAFRIIFQEPTSWKWPMLAIFAAFMLSGLTETWTHDKEIAILYWSFLGAVENFRRSNFLCVSES